SINGLGAIVQEEMNLDPFSSALFIFCCARRKRIKILYWEKKMVPGCTLISKQCCRNSVWSQKFNRYCCLP
ncbi:MAG: IS66 family insertion sequence element accessory protein TnpB, partial [Bdellovibrionales bacterium]|nr:IS66 family insertion sequence element accessory protein TnpB [Bdellovibrionales bacterium]